MAKPKVSNLVRVRQGTKTLEVELKDNKLTIMIKSEHQGIAQNITVNEEAVSVIRELLGLTRAGEAIMGKMTETRELATQLPPDTKEEIPADSDEGPAFKEGMA